MDYFFKKIRVIRANPCQNQKNSGHRFSPITQIIMDYFFKKIRVIRANPCPNKKKQ